MDPINHLIAIQRLNGAKEEFSAYLRNAAPIEHFLTVNDPIAPLRRMDGNRINPSRQAFIGSRFAWNTTKARWETVDGSIILAEDELWGFISLVLCRTDVRSEKKLYENMKRRTEGLLSQDLRMALAFWQYFELDELGSDVEATLWEDAAIGVRGYFDATTPSLSPSSESDTPSDKTPYATTPSLSSSSGPNTPGDEMPSPSTQEPPPHPVINSFHPRYSDLLSVGTSGVDGKAVYFAWRPLPRGLKPVSRYYTHDLVLKAKYEHKINWHPHLELDQFEGTQGQKGISRRDFCRRIIKENESTQVEPKKGSAARAKAATAAAPRSSHSQAQSRQDHTVTPVQPKPFKRRRPADSPVASDPSEESSQPRAKRPRRALGSLAQSNPGLNTDNDSVHSTVDLDDDPSDEAETVPNDAVSQRPGSNPTPDTDNGPVLPAIELDKEPLDQAETASNNTILQHPESNPTPDTDNGPVFPTIELDREPSDEPEVVSNNAVPKFPALIKPEPLTYEQTSRTILRVSATNQPDMAPASVPFGICGSLDQLFATMISEYDIQSNGRISRVSATYTWNDKRHLLRRDREEDWVSFCNAIKKAWMKEGNQVKFLEDGCEIDMMVHVD